MAPRLWIAFPITLNKVAHLIFLNVTLKHFFLKLHILVKVLVLTYLYIVLLLSLYYVKHLRSIAILMLYQINNPNNLILNVILNKFGTAYLYIPVGHSNFD